MMRRLAVIVLIAFAYEGLAAEAPTGAEIDHDQIEIHADASLTLRDAVHFTAEREPGSVALEARRAEAIALQRNAGRLLAGSPWISASNVNDGPFSNDGYQQWDAALELPLWWPGQRKGRRRAAQAADAASGHARQAHQLEVAGWVRQAISDLALARLRLDLAQNAWRMEEALAAQVKRAVELGELAQTDLLLAQSASLDRRFEYLRALEEAHHSEGTYSLLTGLTSWPQDWNEMPADGSSFDDHPFLRLAAEEVDRLEGEMQSLVADQWGHPVLALGTQHEREMRGADFSDRIVVGLQIPFGRRADAGRDVAAMRRRLSEVRRDAARLERALRGRLALSEHAYALADERVATATEQDALAAEYLRLIDLGFRLGEADLATLLRARARSRAAEQTRLEALLLRQTNAAQLNQALGVLP